MSDSEEGASYISDGEVFRSILLMYGEGTGDSQNIDTLLDTLSQLLDSAGQTDEESMEGYQNLLAAARKANNRELQEYDKMCVDLEKRIADLFVPEKLLELEKVKKEILDIMKYDSIGKIDSALPSCQESMEKLAKIEEDTEILKAENEVLEKSDEREKQVRLLVASLSESVRKFRELDDWEGSHSD